MVVCEWVGGGLFVMGSCVVCAWCCCYVLCGCMNGASPVRFVLFVVVQPRADCVFLDIFSSFILSINVFPVWSFRQKGRLNTVSCMLHIDSLIRL